MNKIVNYDTKKDALYLECVVLVNGESDPELYKDSQGDTWDSKTIKQVYTSEANQTQHDLYHNKEKVDGVTTISNYISTNDKIIANKTVPSGSWIKELMITDPDIIEMVKSNQINGVSPNFRLHENAVCVKELKNIKGNIFYNSDIQNKECMKPIFLSLVDEPANEYGLEVFSYDKYLEKSKNPRDGGKMMSNKFKEMLKGFGESIVNYANEMEEPELEKAEEEETAEEELTTETTETTEENTTASNENILSEEDSFEVIEKKVESAVQDKYFPEDENGNKIYIGVALTFSDAIVVQDWDNDKYYKVGYSIDGDTVTLGELQEVELKYVVKDSEEETTEETIEEAPAETESQKSKQPQIRVKEEKLDDVELEKQNTKERTNHLGFPIKSTTELAKNKFNF